MYKENLPPNCPSNEAKEIDTFVYRLLKDNKYCSCL